MGDCLITDIFIRVHNYVYTPEEALHYGTETFDLVSKGSLKIRIYNEYPFTAEGIQQAHQAISSGRTTGKLVIKVAD